MKTYINKLAKFVAVAVFLTAGSSVYAQTTGTQQFTVVVGDIMSITAPTDVSITHDGTDADQGFGTAASSWDVLCNQGAGATVTFVTDGLFTNTVGTNTYTRDYTMDLAVSSDPDSVWSTVAGSASWASATDGAIGTVQAESSGPGNSSLTLDVTFIDSDYSQLPSGSYTMGVTATIVAN